MIILTAVELDNNLWLFLLLDLSSKVHSMF